MSTKKAINGINALTEATLAVGSMTSDLIPLTTNVYNLGTSALEWNNCYANNITSATSLTSNGTTDATTFSPLTSSNQMSGGLSVAKNIVASGVSGSHLYKPSPDGTGALFISTVSGLCELKPAALTNGQLLVGSSGVDPVAAAITGTSNQVIVTNAAGSITLSLPQSIATSSAVTFGSVQAGAVCSAQSGTSYTLQNTDLNTTIYFTNASAIVVTLPTNIMTTIGNMINVLQGGTGQITFTTSGGAVINGSAGFLTTANQYSGASLFCVGTNTCILTGNLI